jgi:integrase
MTTPTHSRATLQDVLAAIDQAHDLSDKRRQDLRSAVCLAAKVLATEPHLIAADPRGIGRRFDEASPISMGLSAGRWANVRSLLRSALKLVVAVMPGAGRVPLSVDWELLAAEARKVGSCWLRLSRLLRWLSARQITPATVMQGDIEQFRVAFMSDALLGNPEQSWQATRRSWERMRQACPTWPQIALEKAPNPMVYSLPWEAYPGSLKDEVDRYLDRQAGKDLSEDGPVRPLRPATLKLRTHELRSFAAALVHRGIDPQSLTSLADCLTLDNYKLGLEWFYRRGGGKPSATVHNIAANLRQIASHWLKADDATLSAMSKIVSKLAPPKQNMSGKNRERLRAFDSLDQLQALTNLPRTIRRHVERAKSATVRKTGLSTAAMAIEILVNAPMRISNLCQLHLDKNFIRVGDKTHLFMAKEDVKNVVDLEFELPPETVAMIEWYMASYRKADPQNRYLFAGRGLVHKAPNTMRSQLMGAIKAFTGHTVNPHLFRAIAGSIYLDANPGDYETVRSVLGHGSINTTARFYAGHMDRRARQHFVSTVTKLRQVPGGEVGKKGRKS